MQIHQKSGVLTPDQCEFIISTAGVGIERSRVSHGSRRAIDSARTSWGKKLDRAQLPADMQTALDDAIYAFTGQPATHQEPREILRYRAGERFGPHFDLSEASAAAGLRQYTALIYLRAPSAGGETVFPTLTQSVRPEAGKMVSWQNTRNGAINPQTLHESCAVVGGEKWALVTWIGAVPHVG
jgi:prolyl 4-hydroxylase